MLTNTFRGDFEVCAARFYTNRPVAPDASHILSISVVLVNVGHLSNVPCACEFRA